MKACVSFLVATLLLTIHGRTQAGSELITVLICNESYSNKEDSIPRLSDDCRELLNALSQFEIKSGMANGDYLLTNIPRAGWTSLLQDWKQTLGNMQDPPAALLGIYTGHGVTYGGDYYMVPTNVTIDPLDIRGSLQTGCIEGNAFLREFVKDANLPSVMIFDSCRTSLGPLTSAQRVHQSGKHKTYWTTLRGGTAKAGNFIKLLTQVLSNAGSESPLASLMLECDQLMRNSTGGGNGEQRLVEDGVNPDIVMRRRVSVSGAKQCVTPYVPLQLQTDGCTVLPAESDFVPVADREVEKKAVPLGFIVSPHLNPALVVKPTTKHTEHTTSPGAWLLHEIEQPLISSERPNRKGVITYHFPEIGPQALPIKVNEETGKKWVLPDRNHVFTSNTTTLCRYLAVSPDGVAATSEELIDWTCEKNLFLTENTTIRVKNLTIRDGVSLVTNGNWLNLQVYGDLKIEGHASIVSFKMGLLKNGKICAAAGRDGKPGDHGRESGFENVNGGNGAAGAAGFKGADAGGCVIAVLGNASGTLTAQLEGMQGGDGGNGGAGGNGGDMIKRTASGGVGGNGGNGGPGGDGGAGGIFYLYVPNGGDSLIISNVNVRGGAGGKGGSPGQGGKGGLGNDKPNGTDGKPGEAARDGKRGREGMFQQRGNIFVLARGLPYREVPEIKE